MPGRLFRLRMLLLLMLAGTILSTGASYWLGERRMQADLEFLRSHGAVTEIPVIKGQATYQEATDYWNNLPVAKQSEANKWIETYKVTRYRESRQALADLAPLLSLLEKAAAEPDAEWHDMDVSTLYAFADFLSSKAVLEASSGNFAESMAAMRVLKRLSDHALDYGGTSGYLRADNLESAYWNLGFTMLKYPGMRPLLHSENHGFPRVSIQELLKEEVARSLAVTETREYRDSAVAWAQIPEDVPPTLARAAVGNRVVKRAVKQKLVRAWAQVMPVVDGSEAVLADAVRTVHTELKQDKSFSGRIAAEQFSHVRFLVEKLETMQKDQHERHRKLRELLR